MVCVIPGCGQEAAKFMLIAEVEKDALAWDGSVREKDGGGTRWLLA